MTRPSKPIMKNKKVTSFENNDLPSLLKRTVLELGPPTVAGTAAFATTLAFSTFTQLKFFGISTGTMAPIPSIAGVLSVAAASLASQTVSIKAYKRWNDHDFDHSYTKLQSLPNSIRRQIETLPEYCKKKDPSQFAQDMKIKAQKMGINMKAKALEMGNDVKVKANEMSVDLPSIGNNWKDTVDITSVSHAIRV